MKLNPCDCGDTPAITERTLDARKVVQVKCSCGARGASVLYTKPADEERTKQAAVDGWNFEHPVMPED
jgi:hypothetical protein